MISFDQALEFTLENIQPLGVESVDLLAAEGRIAGQDLKARVDSPSVDVSFKDGYAVQSGDLAQASPQNPVRLALVGSIPAGGSWEGEVRPGTAVRILSGAPIPEGADAVVAEEFTQAVEGSVLVLNTAHAGRNVLPQGLDVRAGSTIVPAGRRLSPTVTGLLAAAGLMEVQVARRPRVAIIATGDEVLSPGQPLVQGKLYASNLFTLAAWCRHYGFEVEAKVLQDDQDIIREALVGCLERFDGVLTSGGAWKGERDLVVHILDELGWQKVYHRVRIGPGKAVGFGLFEGKPVFCLPGGPPSNHMAFLQLALPGLQKLAGFPEPGLARAPAMMVEKVSGQVDWTQFIHGRLGREAHCLTFHPMRYKSRLQEMSLTEAIVKIPEGETELEQGSVVMVQVLEG
jgi:molybdopterin molybdotransferase